MNDGERFEVGATTVNQDQTDALKPPPDVSIETPLEALLPRRQPPPARELSRGWVRLKRIPDQERITAVTVSRGERARVVSIPNFDVVDVPLDVARVALATGSFEEDKSNFAKVKK